MANTNSTYTDQQIMKALLTKDFSYIGREFEDHQCEGGCIYGGKEP